jgi:hypothetical protein
MNQYLTQRHRDTEKDKGKILRTLEIYFFLCLCAFVVKRMLA